MHLGLVERKAVEIATEAIHKARTSHTILKMVATKSDSVMLAEAALVGLIAAGFKITKTKDGV